MERPEHEEVRLPVLERLSRLGWSRGQIVCPSPDSGDVEWRVPHPASEHSKREAGRSYKGYPVDLVIFDSGETAGRLPAPGDNLVMAGREPLTFEDLATPTDKELRGAFERILNRIAAADSVSTRPEQRLNETANLLILKIESDKAGAAHIPKQEASIRASSSAKRETTRGQRFCFSLTRQR